MKSQQLNILNVNDLIAPVWVLEGNKRHETPSSCAGIPALSSDLLLLELEKMVSAGIKSIILFPYLDENKNLKAEQVFNAEGLMPRAIKEIKQHFPTLEIMAEAGIDSYNLDSQAGENPNKLALLIQQASSLAAAGIDTLIFNSADIQFLADIRKSLSEANFEKISLITRTTNFNSALYSTNEILHKNKIKEYSEYDISNDISENMESMRNHFLAGSDYIMFEPALLYLDILQEIKNSLKIPFMVNQIAGEYLILKVAAQSKLYNEKALVLETLAAIKRAGATKIITFYAKQAAVWLKADLERKSELLDRSKQNVEAEPGSFIEKLEKEELATENPNLLFVNPPEVAADPQSGTLLAAAAVQTEKQNSDATAKQAAMNKQAQISKEAENKKIAQHKSAELEQKQNLEAQILQKNIIDEAQNKQAQELVQIQNREQEIKQGVQLEEKQNLEAQILQKIIIEDAQNRLAEEMTKIQNQELIEKQNAELLEKQNHEAQVLQDQIIQQEQNNKSQEMDNTQNKDVQILDNIILEDDKNKKAQELVDAENHEKWLASKAEEKVQNPLEKPTPEK